MKVDGLEIVVDEYVGRLTPEQAYVMAQELMRRAKQAWPYYVQTGQFRLQNHGDSVKCQNAATESNAERPRGNALLSTGRPAGTV